MGEGEETCPLSDSSHHDLPTEIHRALLGTEQITVLVNAISEGPDLPLNGLKPGQSEIHPLLVLTWMCSKEILLVVVANLKLKAQLFRGKLNKGWTSKNVHEEILCTNDIA